MLAIKKRQKSSKLMVDPCDSWTQCVQEMCRAAGQDFRCCRTSDSFERGSYEQRTIQYVDVGEFLQQSVHVSDSRLLMQCRTH